MVMYLGKVAEIADAAQLYAEPQHPYSGSLLSAVPIANPRAGRSRKSVVLQGDVPNPINPPSGCRFHTRCPRFQEGVCDVVEPRITEVTASHGSACFFPLEHWPMTAEEISSVDSDVVARRKREIVPAEPAAEPATAPV
jgi:oligopeptide/dipeptide ABC transporter ATP-binding protein